MPSLVDGTTFDNCPELIEFVADRMCAGAYKHAIKRELEVIVKEEVKIKIYENIRKAARKVIIERSASSSREFTEDAISFLRSVIGDETIRWPDRLRAQEKLIDLLGLTKRQGSAEDHAEAVRLASEKMRAV